MAFRTVEINEPAELHVDEGQLTIQRDIGTLRIPLEDIACLMLGGPSIRISSMGLSILAEKEVAVTFYGRNFKPTATLQALYGNARQSLTAKQQVWLPQECNDALWTRIVERKIENQARVLSILGLTGAEKVAKWAQEISPGDTENHEGTAAAEYFPLLHPGLNRRSDDSFNSVLNYGYSILRTAIIKAIVTSGMLPGFGLHHRSQLNAFNLADDLIEPFRACVDIVAPKTVNPAARLSADQRHSLVAVLHHACSMDDKETTVANAIEVEADSLKRAIESEDPTLLILPIVLVPKFIEGVIE